MNRVLYYEKMPDFGSKYINRISNLGTVGTPQFTKNVEALTFFVSGFFAEPNIQTSTLYLASIVITQVRLNRAFYRFFSSNQPHQPDDSQIVEKELETLEKGFLQAKGHTKFNSLTLSSESTTILFNNFNNKEISDLFTSLKPPENAKDLKDLYKNPAVFQPYDGIRELTVLVRSLQTPNKPEIPSPQRSQADLEASFKDFDLLTKPSLERLKDLKTLKKELARSEQKVEKRVEKRVEELFQELANKTWEHLTFIKKRYVVILTHLQSYESNDIETKIHEFTYNTFLSNFFYLTHIQTFIEVTRDKKQVPI